MPTHSSAKRDFLSLFFPFKRAGDPRRGHKLKTLYYISAAALATLIPLVMLTGFWLQSEARQDRREFEGFLVSRAQMLSQTIDQEMRQRLVTMEALSYLPSLDEPDLPAFQNTAARLVAAMSDLAVISLIKPESGKQLLNTLQPPGVEPGTASLPDIVRQVAQERIPKIVIRQPKPDSLYPGRLIVIYVPIIRNGESRLVLAAGFKPDILQNLLIRQNKDPQFLSVIVDEKYMIAARTRLPEKYIGEPSSSQFQSFTNKAPSGISATTTLDNQHVFTAFHRSPLTNWLGVVSADRGEIDRLTQRSRFSILAAIGVSAVLAVVLAVFMFHTLMEKRLGDERIAASKALGELDSKLLSQTKEALTEQQKSASEREVLLKEVYHRVKNNLQIIQSLLRLGSRNLPEVQKLPFDGAIRRIGAMARVHNLLYTSPDLNSIDFKDYLAELIKESGDAFGASQRGINTVFEAKPMRIALDTAVPLAFVAVELLTNAYRHGFPPGRTGTVTIKTEIQDNQGVLIFEDDGVGVSLPTSRTSSLGLTIVEKLVDQIAGTLSKPQSGSRFVLTFPLQSA